jgi:hypothetical protein
MTTAPAPVQRDTTTEFHPALKLKVPSWFHCPPPVRWSRFTLPRLAPLALNATNGVDADRLVPEVHQASMVRDPAWSRRNQNTAPSEIGAVLANQ